MARLAQTLSLTRVQGWGGAYTKPTPGATVSAAWRLGLCPLHGGPMGMRARTRRGGPCLGPVQDATTIR